jgi:hypothetical protein
VVDVIEAPDAQGLASPRPGSSDAFAVGRLLTWARHGQCPGMEQFRTTCRRHGRCCIETLSCGRAELAAKVAAGARRARVVEKLEVDKAVVDAGCKAVDMIEAPNAPRIAASQLFRHFPTAAWRPVVV